jgi:D-serine deaminase-like pyridoxal phosphate-dependent protein
VKNYEIRNVNEIATPALAVYPSVILNNIKIAIEITGDTLLRPHIKTCKTAAVVQMMIDVGIQHFKCATIAEAELLGTLKVKDVLMAYQPVSINIQRLKKIIAAYPETKYSCLIDNKTTLKAIDEVFNKEPLAVFIDLNAGMNRTGLHPKQASSFIDACLTTKGIILKGIHVYDGDINDVAIGIRTQKANAAYKKAADIRQLAEHKSERKMDLVIGGTPTFPIHANRPNVQCSPGTFIFWDDGYSAFKDLPFNIAALVLTRVVSIIDDQHICLDLGHKAIASENPLNKRVNFLNAEVIKLISHSEEHMVVEVKESSKHFIGEVWYGVPFHICPTVALHQHLQVIENRYCTKQWEVIARNRKINF